ncbi:hypothetical protein HYE10_03765 [Mycoplasmopsis bovis]|nr:hypothetical protein HYE10_03765 [Mycoplasmopsis bovis]
MLKVWSYEAKDQAKNKSFRISTFKSISGKNFRKVSINIKRTEYIKRQSKQFEAFN